jgi:hypothetical protein
MTLLTFVGVKGQYRDCVGLIKSLGFSEECILFHIIFFAQHSPYGDSLARTRTVILWLIIAAF